MKIISWNVNGIRAVEKKDFCTWLNNCGADVVCIQETKARPEQLSDALLSPALYKSYWSSAEKPGYRGSNKILKLMNRKYTREEYLQRIADIKRIIPGCGINLP